MRWIIANMLFLIILNYNNHFLLFISESEASIFCSSIPTMIKSNILSLFATLVDNLITDFA